MNLEQMGQAARAAAYTLAETSTRAKNQALLVMADALEAAADDILAANARDLAAARESGTGESMLDRLMLNPARIKAIADDVRNVVSLPDPVGSELDSRVLENGMRLSRRRVPLGVVGVIYEARPNVTIDIAALCLKTGNASILRGGRETFHTNQELVKVIQQALAASQLPPGCVQYISEPGREWVSGLLKLDQYVDMIIPRGGPGLHQLCKEQATIPVIIGGFGIGHIFVDDSADLVRAIEVIDNAKTQRPSVCNAIDTLLVHQAVADEFLPVLSERMAEKGVELVAGADALTLLSSGPAKARAAIDGDFDTEWLGLTLGVKIVAGVDEALAHLREHNASHSDAILTSSLSNAERFINGAPSAAVYVNASTRFTDGAQFGLGAEVAVSTQKLHARGPMGLEELTSYKWIGQADYLIRD
ncbi:glutamate-5-semialdehyde dehydrogenase [Oceanisphaera arctica]|uniref:Gamma-glutamyl phosphate reductase n=1 Tax=Oceanisphaera arctica TaxID=641510 RepID=A0A2P5TLE2_9GAMM|nr:glutamate-5-semialdehyde dehydrogenase [Oceanisphaera arctica]PPL16095.1 glutamate-5-semialdehyde dehydrogenase [Oceanisphaera arctica]GHA26389.1 gamma-glutamyl phosphate reductase [Oceanisphaera arctica]